MKFDIKNRYTNEKIRTVELEKVYEKDAYMNILGLVALWTIQNESNIDDLYILDRRLSYTNIDGNNLVNSNFSIEKMTIEGYFGYIKTETTDIEDDKGKTIKQIIIDAPGKMVGIDLHQISISHGMIVNPHIIYSKFDIDDISYDMIDFVSKGLGTEEDYYSSLEKKYIDHTDLFIHEHHDYIKLPLPLIKGRII